MQSASIVRLLDEHVLENEAYVPRDGTSSMDAVRSASGEGPNDGHTVLPPPRSPFERPPPHSKLLPRGWVHMTLWRMQDQADQAVSATGRTADPSPTGCAYMCPSSCRLIVCFVGRPCADISLVSVWKLGGPSSLLACVCHDVQNLLESARSKMKRKCVHSVEPPKRYSTKSKKINSIKTKQHHAKSMCTLHTTRFF